MLARFSLWERGRGVERMHRLQVHVNAFGIFKVWKESRSSQDIAAMKHLSSDLTIVKIEYGRWGPY